MVTNDPEVAPRVRLIRNHGTWKHGDAVMPGLNSRMDDLQAVILSAKLPYLEGWNARRREIAETYRELLDGAALRIPEVLPDRLHVYHLFPVRCINRDRVRSALTKSGVETLVHYHRAIHLRFGYTHLQRLGKLSESERFANEVVSIPLNPELTDAEVELVCSALKEAVGWAGKRQSSVE